MKKYLYTFLVLFFFSSKLSFARFNKINLGSLKVEIRKESLGQYCSCCQLPHKKFYESFAHAPDEAWVLIWSDSIINEKVSELRKKGILKKEDNIIGLTSNKNSIGTKGKLYFFICDKRSSETLRQPLTHPGHMPTWDFIVPKGNYQISLSQVEANSYTFVLEDLQQAQYEWND